MQLCNYRTLKLFTPSSSLCHMQKLEFCKTWRPHCPWWSERGRERVTIQFSMCTLCYMILSSSGIIFAGSRKQTTAAVEKEKSFAKACKYHFFWILKGNFCEAFILPTRVTPYSSANTTGHATTTTTARTTLLCYFLWCGRQKRID